MIVRMIHPQHGATHVYDVSELEKLKGWGWSVEGEEPKKEAEPVEADPEPVKRKYTRKAK